jgi:hypothetical protein
VVQQEGQLRIAVFGNVRLADTQRDTSHRQVKRIKQAVRRPVSTVMPLSSWIRV